MQVHAQTGSQRNLKTKITADTLFLDSLTILPGSLIITKGTELLNKEDKHLVKTFIDAFITKRQIQQLAI